MKMNHFRKTIFVLTLAASLGLGTQAFAEMGADGTGTTGTYTGTTGNDGTGTGTSGTSGTVGTTTTPGTGTTNTATGTSTTGYGTTSGATPTHHLLDRMNTHRTKNTGDGYGGNYNTYSYRANADTTTRGTNWGWLGLLGLLGLAGMRGRNRNESHDGMK
jgi:hypothetical protein